MRRRLWWTGLVTVLALGLTACGGSGAGSDGGNGESDVSVALDFVPNAGNSAVFVAEKLGYFKEAKLKVKVVPYGQTPPNTLVSTGKVDFAILDTLASAMFDITAGNRVKSVLAGMQHDPSHFGVLPQSSIQSPKDFCGKTYGGFGYPADPALIQAMIKGAGGPADCEFRTVTLGSSAYQAVAGKKVDFSIFFFSDLIEAELKHDITFRNFRPHQYGIPDEYALLYVGYEPWLKEHPKQAAGFVGAIQRAYEYIHKNPVEGAKILKELNPNAVDEEAATKAVQEMAKNYLIAPDGKIGAQDPKIWNDFGRFLFQAGVFKDASGKPLTKEPDWSRHFTNEYLRAGS